jgi:putative tryptophan/tyrosine transport system substrate-binding protein
VGKRIELLKEWLPQTRRIAVLARPQHPGESLERKASEEAAAKLGLELSYFPYFTRSFLPARDLSDLETAFRAIVQDRCDALVVFPDSAMYELSERIARFALEAKLPSVSGWSSFANKGLLVTYGPNVRALYRSLAGYVDRILRGTSPADLPFQAPTTHRQGARPRPAAATRRPRRRGDRVSKRREFRPAAKDLNAQGEQRRPRSYPRAGPPGW